MGVVVTGAEIERSASVSPVPTDVQVAKVAGAKPRNVVFILSDDHRYDAMSFLGHQFAETPHLDSHLLQTACIMKMHLSPHRYVHLVVHPF